MFRLRVGRVIGTVSAQRSIHTEATQFTPVRAIDRIGGLERRVTFTGLDSTGKRPLHYLRAPEGPRPDHRR